MTGLAIDTQNMTTSVLPPKKMPLLYAGLFGAAMTLAGPTAGVTLPSTRSVQFAPPWTSGVNAPSPPDGASAVRSLKERSGLSWQQFADAFGVSRRSLHFWVNGGNMAPSSQDRLRVLTEVVDGIRSAHPAVVRDTLLTPGADGRSPFDELVSAVTPRRVVPRKSIAAQLNTVQDDTKHPGRVISSKTLSIKLAEF